MFEIYKSIVGRKTYIVSTERITDVLKYAKKYFKVAASRIICHQAWIIDEDLYLENPHNRQAHKVWVAYLK